MSVAYCLLMEKGAFSRQKEFASVANSFLTEYGPIDEGGKKVFDRVASPV